MARMLRRVALLVLLVPGCASRHPRSGPDSIYPGYVTAPDYGGTNSAVGQTLMDASANDWNFRPMFR